VARFHSRPYPQAPYLLEVLNVARAVDAGAVAAKWAEQPARIKEAVHAARVATVEKVRPQLLQKHHNATAHMQGE